MSDGTKLNRIPRAARQPVARLEELVADNERSPADKEVTIKAKVSPELKRRLRHAAVDADTSLANILRVLAQKYVDEQGY